jgi:hypothetical protein
MPFGPGGFCQDRFYVQRKPVVIFQRDTDGVPGGQGDADIPVLRGYRGIVSGGYDRPEAHHFGLFRNKFVKGRVKLHGAGTQKDRENRRGEDSHPAFFFIMRPLLLAGR